MQRTAVDQATPHGAHVPELPPELVVSIVRAGKDGIILVKMLQVCKAWRRALTAESASLWREVALARYPRLHDVLAIAGAQPQPPDFRALYRSQLSAQRIEDESPPPFHAYVMTVELQTFYRSAHDAVHGRQSGRHYLIARASERLDRMVNYDEAMGTSRLGGRAVLTMEPPASVKSVRGWDGHVPTGADFGEWVRDHAFITLYVTRLSDLKTAKIAEIADVVPEYPENRVDEQTNYDNYTHEGDEPCIVHRCEVLERGTPIFDDDGNMPIVYSSFAPSQMVFKFDFWEERGDRRENPPDGPGPAGEVYMAETELRDYLRWHARWSD